MRFGSRTIAGSGNGVNRAIPNHGPADPGSFQGLLRNIQGKPKAHLARCKSALYAALPDAHK